MKSVLPQPQPASFFVPIGIGVLLQMASVGLVTAVTVIGSAPAGSRVPATAPLENSATLPAGNSPEAVPPESTPRLAASDQPAKNIDNSGAPMRDDGNSAPDEATSTEPNQAANPEMADTKHSQPAATDEPAPGEADRAPVAGNAAAAAQAKPLEDVRARSRILKIAGEGVPDEVTLCEVRVDNPSNVELELLDTEFPKLKIELEKQPVEGQSCKWTVRQVSAAGFDRVQPLGEFQITAKQLRFKWHKNADKGKLPFCRLKISADTDTEVCNLWSPVKLAALKMNIDVKAIEISTFVPPGILLPPAESMRLDFTPEGWPKHQLSRNDLALDVPSDTNFSDEDYGHDLLKIQLVLKQERGLLRLQTTWFTTIPKLSTHRGKSEVTYVEQSLKRSDLEKLVKDMITATDHWEEEADDVDKELERTEAQRDQVAEILRGNYREDLANKKTQLDQAIIDLEEEKAAAEELVTTFSSAHTAMKKLAELSHEIEENGRIEFRLVRPLQGDNKYTVISTSIIDEAPE
ncbi:MAG: hypothetical protein JNM43_17060 [Planctomycetaceae bacterium]|nr:hypothetical protein [Planctomycetaceae bacterium]